MEWKNVFHLVQKGGGGIGTGIHGAGQLHYRWPICRSVALQFELHFR